MKQPNPKHFRYDLRMWNTVRGYLMDEATSLDFYRTTYKGKMPRKELEAALTSLETWAAYAYERRLLFEVFARLATDQPYASLLFNDGNAIVHFIDEFNRIYIVYTFSGEGMFTPDNPGFAEHRRPGFLFLSSLHYFEYPDDEKFYKRYESVADTEYVFTPDGQLTVYREYAKEDGHRYQSEERADWHVDVTPNWEPYPALGQYAGLLTFQRWGEQGIEYGPTKHYHFP